MSFPEPAEPQVNPYAAALAELDAALERRDHNETLAEEAERLGRDFFAFVQHAWPLIVAGPMVKTWHIQSLCEHYQAAFEREILRLLVTIPPGFLKSTIFSVFGPAWRWATHPEERILSASYSFGLATRDTRRSRMLMLSGWYQARWGEGFTFNRDENAAVRYSNDRQGHRAALHVGGGTGWRGGVLTLDDPHNAKELHSDAMLRSAKDWWGETWSSRLDDYLDQRGVKVVIGQRISEKDLIGHLLAADEDASRWTHLCLPAEYEPKHPFTYPDHVKLSDGRQLQGDVRKKPGELLAPSFMDEQLLAERTAEVTAQVYAAQYQQRPAPQEGNLLKRALWRYYPRAWSFYAERGVMEQEHLPAFRYIVTSWDTSIKDRAHSDFVSGQVWAVPRDKPADRWLLRLWHQRAGLNETIEAMLGLYDWVGAVFPEVPQYVVIENSANGPDAVAEIKSRVQGVTVWDARGSKEMRAEAAQPALIGRNLYLPGAANEDGTNYGTGTPTDVQEFVEELAVFPGGEHDDQVDAWSQMVNWTRKHGVQPAAMSGVPMQRKPRPAALPR